MVMEEGFPMGFGRIVVCTVMFGLVLPYGALVLASESAPSDKQPSSQSELGVGAINSYQTDTYALLFFRHHFAWDWHGVRLWTGGSLVENGAFWVGGGLRFDLRMGDEWRVCAASGPGYFNKSGELDLGHEVEFHSTIELARAIGHAGEVVAGIGHISNAGLGDYNPGATTYRLSYRWAR
jgi:hypothetical protein